MTSAKEPIRPKRRNRRALAAGELSEKQIEAIRNAKVPDEYAYLDEELKDWKQ